MRSPNPAATNSKSPGGMGPETSARTHLFPFTMFRTEAYAAAPARGFSRLLCLDEQCGGVRRQPYVTSIGNSRAVDWMREWRGVTGHISLVNAGRVMCLQLKPTAVYLNLYVDG